MKATETNLLKFLKQPNQFVIPIYQRTYSWTRGQCQQLWDDMIRVAENEDISGHFVGSIVYIEAGLYTVASVPQQLVIDGQQRLTTISLLLSALAKAIDASTVENLDVTRRKLENYYLFNNEEEGNDRYKLFLTQGDRQTFINLIEDRDLPQNFSKRVVENYHYFENQIRQSSISLNTLYQGINKLIIVNIALDRDRDNPQLIFESLNSTGLDLSQADLIRNYVLMGLTPRDQEEIYTRYWYPMETNFGADQTEQFDRFIRDYLTLKSPGGQIPNIRDVYHSFKTHLERHKGEPVINIMADVYGYSKHYGKLVLNQEPDSDIDKALQDINTLRVEVSYPFLLKVYEDYSQELLTKSEFIEVLRLVESYVFRRVICGIPTNSMNKTFATFAREIDPEDYLNSVKIAFIRKDSYKRFPTDQEFRQEFVVKDIYNLRSRIYLLGKLENFLRRRELADPKNYTIEHILPQNLSEAWRQDLGEQWKQIQAKYLHTIGNLTLTGYNSEYSNRSFREKRDMPGGFKESPLFLNQGLGQLEKWDEYEIQNRANQLADWALNIWKYPDAEGISQESELSENQADYAKYLQGTISELFEALRTRILNLDPSVREEFKKLYIAYKTSTNFVDVIPQRRRLRLSLNLKFDEIHDPKHLCRDITNVGRWGNGDVEVGLSSLDQLDDIMDLIVQSFEKHSDLIDLS